MLYLWFGFLDQRRKDMKLVLVTMLAVFALACSDRPANSSYHNSSNDVRQDNKNVNVNTNVNTNTNTNVNANIN